MIDLEGKLVVSYSALAAFKNCPKSYEIEYEWMRESKHDNEYVKKGSLFHKYMERAAKTNVCVALSEDNPCDMMPIANDYLQYKPLPEVILFAEDPMFYEVLPGVVFRVTPDLVYMRGGTIICRDYKTFSKRPPMDLHISDQSRFYIIILEALNPGYNVEFEFEYVRSERINVRRGPRSVPWTASDSYFTVPDSLSSLQKERTWQDLRESLMVLGRARYHQEWYRTGRMTNGIGGCSGCFQRPLCAEEWEHGFVSQERLEALSTQRESLIKIEEV